MLGRRVDVDHELDVVDVHAAGRDVGGHEDLDVARGERREVAVAGDLREVAVQVHRRDARVGELLRELLRVVLGAHEEDAAAGAARELLDEEALGLDVGRLEDVVRHGGDGRVRLVDGVQHLVVQVAAHELVHAVVERGGEQHALAGVRGLVEDPRDDGQEAQVGHVVGLVEHGDLHGVEVHEALLHEVLEAAGAGHDHVDAGLEGRDLALLRDAAEDRRGGEVVGLGQRRHGRGDLRGELAGRREDQAERAARTTTAAGEPAAEARDHRDGERQRLAGARLAAAEHVAAVQGVGERVHLDGERRRDAVRREGGDEGCGHAERAEGVSGHAGELPSRQGSAPVCVLGDVRRRTEAEDGEGADGRIRSPKERCHSAPSACAAI
ncbi:hypothetical protein CMMCAS05_03410 [Clavibacter michiganensis subsp. michiganensis]|nr:hypothetical protein CMMCAS05_03410 [Clavibacter michiganensis subsp. michiganensis]